jgi:hypothetical protein
MSVNPLTPLPLVASQLFHRTSFVCEVSTAASHRDDDESLDDFLDTVVEKILQIKPATRYSSRRRTKGIGIGSSPVILPEH